MSTRVVRSEVSGKWMFDTGKHLMEASCHHRAGGACGGCYARAVETLSAIAKDDGNEKARTVLTELKEEGR
jgi:hypothetical protein